jgi:hypothetical protein
MGSFCYPPNISAELCSAHAYNRGSSPSPIPDLPGIRGPSPSPSPNGRGSGVHPRAHPRFAGKRGSSPSPVPIGGSVPWLVLRRKWAEQRYRMMTSSWWLYGRALVPLTVFECPKFRDDDSDRVLHPGVYPVTHDGPIRLHGPRVHRIYLRLSRWRA